MFFSNARSKSLPLEKGGQEGFECEYQLASNPPCPSFTKGGDFLNKTRIYLTLFLPNTFDFILKYSSLVLLYQRDNSKVTPYLLKVHQS